MAENIEGLTTEQKEQVEQLLQIQQQQMATHYSQQQHTPSPMQAENLRLAQTS